MKTPIKSLLLAAFAALSLGIGVAVADPASNVAGQTDGSQYYPTAGERGWG